MLVRPAAVLVLLALLALPARALAADAPANVQGDAAHTGAVSGDLAPPLGKRWVREDLGDTFGTPVIAEGKVFVVAQSSRQTDAWPASSRLYALDGATGATVWSQPALTRGIAYGDGNVYAVTGETTFQAFDAATGAMRWTRRFEQDQGLEGYPTADGGEVYIHGDELYALNASDGSDRLRGATTGFGVALTPDRVFAAYGNGARAYERRLGVNLWSQSGSYGGNDERTVPVAAGGRLYVSSGSEGSIYDQADGRLLGAFTGEMPAVAGGRMFNAVQTIALRAADAETGATLWERRFEDGVRTLPLVVGDVVYVRAGDDALVGYDAASGAERFRSTTRVTARSSLGMYLAPGLAARGDLLVAPFTGKLIGYGPGPDAPGVDPDPFRAPESVTLRFTSPRGKTSRVFGGTGVFLGAELLRREQAADDSPVELQEDLWPFDDEWRTIQTSRASYDDIEFGSVKPDRNARYRLRYGGVDPAALTDPLTVWTDLAVRVRYRYLSRTRLRAIVTLRGPRDALARRTRFHFYFFRKRTGRSRRIKTITLRRRGNVLTRRTVMRVPLAFGRRDYVFPCYREAFPDAWGKPIDGLRLCGRRRI